MIAGSLQRLTGKWWTFLVRGVLALALALFAFVAPGPTAGGLVLLLATYFVLSGALSLYAGISFNGVGHWWALVLIGILQIALGLIMVAIPLAGALSLAYLCAVWAISTGIMEISSGIALRGQAADEFWSILLGVLTLAFGFYVIVEPGIGILTLVFTVGFYALLAGGALFALAFRLRTAGAALGKLGGAVAGGRQGAAR
jgi:uncharacterized membrane protein HdeD (DUF308 family)